MGKTLVDMLHDNREKAEDFLKTEFGDYEDLVKFLISLYDQDAYGVPDVNNIVKIDHGNYQGTLVFIIPEKTYQPNRYWYIKTGYGSCSGCDALESAKYSENKQEELYKILHDLASNFREMYTGE